MSTIDPIRVIDQAVHDLQVKLNCTQRRNADLSDCLGKAQDEISYLRVEVSDLQFEYDQLKSRYGDLLTIAEDRRVLLNHVWSAFLNVPFRVVANLPGHVVEAIAACRPPK